MVLVPAGQDGTQNYNKFPCQRFSGRGHSYFMLWGQRYSRLNGQSQSGSGVTRVRFFHPGEISNSAISIVSELLVLAGAILGVKTSYDAKFVRIDAELRKKADKPEIE